MTVFSWALMLTPHGAAPEVQEALVEFVHGRAGDLWGAAVLSCAARAASQGKGATTERY